MAIKKHDSKFWFKREKEILDSLNLTPTARSGAGWLEKEDGYNDSLLVQLKGTEADSYRVQMDDLRKLEYHAMKERKASALILDFVAHNKLYILIEVEELSNVMQALSNNYRAAEAILVASEDGSKQQAEARKIIKSGQGSRSEFWDEVKTRHNENKERRRINANRKG